MDNNIVKRALELENIKLRAIDPLHVACAEKFADVMLTTDDEIVKKIKNSRVSVNIRVENPVRWLVEVLKDE